MIINLPSAKDQAPSTHKPKDWRDIARDWLHLIGVWSRFFKARRWFMRAFIIRAAEVDAAEKWLLTPGTLADLEMQQPLPRRLRWAVKYGLPR